MNTFARAWHRKVYGRGLGRGVFPTPSVFSNMERCYIIQQQYHTFNYVVFTASTGLLHGKLLIDKQEEVDCDVYHYGKIQDKISIKLH